MSYCAIVILNWNGGNDTIACLHSLMPLISENDFVFVIDNGSTDNSVAEIRAFLDSAKMNSVTANTEDLKRVFSPANKFYITYNGKNLGFGAGNNQLLTRLKSLSAEFSFAWLLNNDALAEGSSLTSLKQRMQDELTAVAGSMIVNYPETDVVQCTGVKYFKWLGVSKLINKNKRRADLNDNGKINFDYLNGASMMLRLSALEKAGYFDERFFLYSEEHDLQVRLQKHNYKLVLDRQSVVSHRMSEATRKSRHMFYYYYNSSAMMLSRKHFHLFFNLTSLLGLFFITFIRTFGSLKEFWWGIRGIIKGWRAV